MLQPAIDQNKPNGQAQSQGLGTYTLHLQWKKLQSHWAKGMDTGWGKELGPLMKSEIHTLFYLILNTSPHIILLLQVGN